MSLIFAFREIEEKKIDLIISKYVRNKIILYIKILKKIVVYNVHYWVKKSFSRSKVLFFTRNLFSFTNFRYVSVGVNANDAFRGNNISIIIPLSLLPVSISMTRFFLFCFHIFFCTDAESERSIEQTAVNFTVRSSQRASRMKIGLGEIIG